MNFRPDINGLRAIAVIAVVIFHFRPAWLSGGFAGVDVFFVISGYLMTAIIYGGLKGENFSLVKFYASRARRIIPALGVLCFVLLVFGWFYLLPSDYEVLGKHVAGSLGFLSNFVYWKEAGYFSALAHEKWLLHTWSLSVEWQFYILYPLVLMVLNKFLNLSRIRWFILVGCFLGFVFSVYVSYRWPTSSFYLLPARAWEMLIGGVAFLFPIFLSNVRKKQLEIFGVILIIASYIFLSQRDVWPGYLALFPVLGSFMIIIANRNDSFLTCNPLFQFIGKISYSIYLWHWPIVIFGHNQGLLSEIWYLFLGGGMSIIMGYLSFVFIENTNRKKFRYKLLIPYVSVTLLGVVVYSFDGVVSGFRSISISDQASFYSEYERESYLKQNQKHYKPECNFFNEDTFSAKTTGIDEKCTQKTGEGGVFLWGDSHAQALSYGLEHILPTDVPFYQVATSGCGPRVDGTPFSKGEFKTACDKSNKFALERMQAIKPSVVIMAQKANHEMTDFGEIASFLKKNGIKHVILVGPVPQWQPSLPSAIVKRHWELKHQYIDDPGLDNTVINTDQILKEKYGLSDKLEFISFIDELCVGNNCLARVNKYGDLLVWDYGHLTKEGSIYVIENIVYKKIKDMRMLFAKI